MTKVKKKILFIHHGGGQGGAFKSLITTINDLDKEEYLAKLLILDISDGSAIKLCEKTNIDFELVNGFLYRKLKYFFIHSEVGPVKWYKIHYFIKVILYWFLSAHFFAPRILKGEAPDIVHINSSVLSDWAYAAKKVRIKNVIHIREPIAKGIFGFRRKILQYIICRNADHIIAISQDNAKRVNCPYKTTIIYDNVDTGRNLVSTEGYTNKAILYAGGTEIHKGFITFAESIEYIDRSILIYFAGIISFPKRKFWQPSFKLNNRKVKLYEKMKKNKNVQFIGFTNDIGVLLSKCTVSISPFSKPHCSMLVLESYSMRKPSIGSDVEGMDEIIENGKSGLLFKVNNPVSLANAINEICLNPIKAKEMGEYGFKKFSQEFSNNGNNRIKHIYNHLISPPAQ